MAKMEGANARHLQCRGSVAMDFKHQNILWKGYFKRKSSLKIVKVKLYGIAKNKTCYGPKKGYSSQIKCI